MSYSLSDPTSPAVEVVATLGDSVVGVAHVRDPRGGTTRPATRAMIIGGAIAIAIGALAFYAATRIASANDSALAAWVAGKKPAWSFRPEMVPTWYGVVSFLGFSAGLTAMVAGLARRKRELEPAAVTIGTAAGVDFAVDGTTAAAQQLVAPRGDHFVLDLTGMTGEITSADGTHSITPMATALPVTQGLKVRAQIGKVAFHIQATEPARRQHTPLFAMADRRALAFIAASAAAHLGLWAVSRTVPPDPSGAQVALFGEEELSYRLVNVENQEPNPEELEATEDGENQGNDGMRAMALESGTVGSLKDHSLDPAKRKIKNDADPELARKEALEAARTAGVLGSTALRDGDLFASMVGVGQQSGGLDDIDIEGAIAGDGVGAPNGWGQNLSGNDFGGGGNSYRVGGYNKFTDGHNAGEDFGLPSARGCKATSGVCRPHDERVPPVKLDKPTVWGGVYDASIIRRYVKRKIAAISYCYENALLANQSLEGTVLAEWTINMAGKPVEVSAKGVSSAVSSCIAGVVATIEFPKPPEVGIYKVRYPFVLHKHGQ